MPLDNFEAKDPASMTDCDELKKQGNWHFQRAEYDDALKNYERALTLMDEDWNSEERPMNVHKMKPEERAIRSALLKNQAACLMKREKYQDAILSCTRSLAYTPNDTKALFRRIQCLELMNNLGQAYQQARSLAKIATDDKLVEKLVLRLRDAVEVKSMEERSTEKRVNNMFDLLIKDGAMFTGGEKDAEKVAKAADNLVFLARDEAGAERIFREGGLELLNNLLDNDNADLSLSALRCLSYLAEGHKSRTNILLENVTMERIKTHISHEREDISTAATNLLQIIMDTYRSEEEKREWKMESVVFDYSEWIKGLIRLFAHMLNDRAVSGPGRDNVVTLLTRCVPRERSEIRKNPTPWKYEFFCEQKGLERLMACASWGFEQKLSDGELKTSKYEPLKVTSNTVMNCAICFTKLYDDAGSDPSRIAYIETCEKYMKYLFSHNVTGTDLVLNLRAITVATSLLYGPEEVGFKALSSSGLFEVMIAMTSDEHEISQVAAIEAILAAVNKAKNATFVLEHGTSLLKKLYKDSKLDAVKIRALVGLCKVGSSHGGDVSRRVFAEGSSLKLSRQCRKYLSTSAVFEMKKWSVEGLSYLSLDADVKEELCNDDAALKALYDMVKMAKGDMTIAYPTIGCFMNLSNAAEKSDDILPEMEEIARFAKHHVPESHELDKAEPTKKRIQKLVKHGLISILSVFTHTDHVLVTEGLREMIARVMLECCEDKENRGVIMAQGGGKTLLSLSKKNITDKGRLTACQAVARLAITTNPVMAFPGQQTYEAIRSQLHLLKQEQQVDRSSLMNFEALMALTNLASIDDGHRNKIVTTPEMVYCIESLALEQHDMLRRAAVQLMCNLLMCQKYRDLYRETREEATSCDRLKLLVLMCQEDDDETRSAAAGGLATLTSYNPEHCKRVKSVAESWQLSVNIIALDEDPGIRHRALVFLKNISEHDIEIAESLSKIDVKDILIGMSKNLDAAFTEEFDDNHRRLLSSLSTDVLKIWQDHNLITLQG